MPIANIFIPYYKIWGKSTKKNRHSLTNRADFLVQAYLPLTEVKVSHIVVEGEIFGGTVICQNPHDVFLLLGREQILTL